jgi:hypothetical protein
MRASTGAIPRWCGYALPSAPVTVTVTSWVRASTWIWRPLAVRDPVTGEAGTVAPHHSPRTLPAPYGLPAE